MFNSFTLDTVEAHFSKLIIRGSDGSKQTYRSKDAACMMAGIAMRKLEKEPSLKVTWTTDYKTGIRLVEKVRYGSGYVEEWEFVERKA